MITRNDCILLLTILQNEGVDVTPQLEKTLQSKDVQVEVVKFINDHRRFDIAKFYEKLRKSYNAKKSSLYKNIVKEIEDPKTVLTTLASLNLQLLLFCKNVEDEQSFLNQSRFQEINACLLNYSKTWDIIPCIQLLRIIKADLAAFEYFEGRQHEGR